MYLYHYHAVVNKGLLREDLDGVIYSKTKITGEVSYRLFKESIVKGRGLSVLPSDVSVRSLSLIDVSK